MQTVKPVQKAQTRMRSRFRDSKPDLRPKDSHTVRRLAVILTSLNLLLAVNFFPIVPLLGWLNYGRAGRATGWIPDWVMLNLLPGGYSLYWHFGWLLAGAALALSVATKEKAGEGVYQLFYRLNLAALIIYLLVRLVLAVSGIRPDIV